MFDDDDDDDDDDDVSDSGDTNTSASYIAMTITADIQNTSAGTTTMSEFISGGTPSHLNSTVSDSFTGLLFHEKITVCSEANRGAILVVHDVLA